MIFDDELTALFERRDFGTVLFKPKRVFNPVATNPHVIASEEAKPDFAKQQEPPPLVGTPQLLAYFAPGQGPGKKRATKIYGDAELAHVLARIEKLSTVPESDVVKVLATYFGGLRPCELASLAKRTLLTAEGEVKDVLEVTAATAKRSKSRTIPMHPRLKTAITELFDKHPHAERVAFSGVTEKGYRYQTADALSMWFAALYLGAGLCGCTAMSGRHSFATNLAKFAPVPLVQKALGHASLNTTGIYITPSGDLASAILKLGSE